MSLVNITPIDICSWFLVILIITNGRKQNGFVSWICGKINIGATSNLKYRCLFVVKHMDANSIHTLLNLA